MTARVTGSSPVGPASAQPTAPPSPAAAVRGDSGRFAELLRTRAAQPSPPPATAPGGALTDAGRALLARVSHGERALESIVRQAQSGAAFTSADLLAMQARVYRYTQELELFSKLVDRGTSAVKTVLQQNG